MRAVEIEIHNFRSIQNLKLRLESLSLVAGANNAGKSNVIDAIRLFYGNLKWDEFRDFPKVDTGDEDAWVEIEFLPSADEMADLKEEYKIDNGTFRVRNYVRPSKDENGKKREGYYAYEGGKLSNNLFYGAKNVGGGKFGRIVYIPAVSKVDDSTKLTGPSALRDLVSGILYKVVAESPAYSSLNSAFDDFEDSIKTQKSEDGQSLKILEDEISQELSGWETTFELGIQSIQPEDMLKTLVQPKLTDQTHGGEVDQSRFGAGFQRHLVFSLIKLAAKYSSPKRKGVQTKKEFSPQLNWILFEEPEAFLHPTQEETLHESLLTMVRDNFSQVLVTTHSSRFVSRSMDDLTKLIRLRRDDGVTTAHQLRQGELDKFFSSALEKDQIIVPAKPSASNSEVEAQLAVLKLELWMQPIRASAFFAQRVLLVEGPSEVAVYNYLVSRELMTPPIPGFLVIDCMGKYNLHRFISLLGAFGIDHSILYDGDDGKSKDEEVSATIQDTRNKFTKRIKRFDKDLEHAMGIDPVPYKERHRKPQHALYNLEQSNVSKSNLDALVCEFMESAISSD